MTARMMLETGAVKYSSIQPFFLSTGWASPVYIDVERLISFPRIRTAMIELASDAVLMEAGFEQFDSVAGVESSGIAYAAWMAERLSLPLQLVRSKPRGFGREARIGGTLRAKERVLLVDDVTTDGRSKIELTHALRAMDVRVDHVMVIFFYDVFPQTRSSFSAMRVQLHYLATWRDVLTEARATGYLSTAQLDEVELFLQDPPRWSLDHGGIGVFPDYSPPAL